MTGKAGVAIATSGPGVSNLVTGLATANSEGDPIVALGGAAPTPETLKQVGGAEGIGVTFLEETFSAETALARHANPPGALWDYTLGTQLLAPYDFTLAISTAVATLGPDAIILPGPGDSLGSAIAQILITMRWRGLTSRADFTALQASDTPFVLAMARPAQRARVVR